MEKISKIYSKIKIDKKLREAKYGRNSDTL